MSRRASTNKDPSEGIRQALGRHIKILYKANMKLEKVMMMPGQYQSQIYSRIYNQSQLIVQYNACQA